MANYHKIGRNRECDFVDLETMALILEQRVEEARGLCRSEESERQNDQWSIPVFKFHIIFNSTCVLRSENRRFVVALTWSPGRTCATDWILKYTPTPSRLIQTTDTIQGTKLHFKSPTAE